MRSLWLLVPLYNIHQICTSLTSVVGQRCESIADSALIHAAQLKTASFDTTLSHTGLHWIPSEAVGGKIRAD